MSNVSLAKGRSNARKKAMQALYQWSISGNELNEIEQELARARETLARTWEWRKRKQLEGQPLSLLDAEWARVQNQFRDKVEKLNKKIAGYNLEIPSDTFYRMPVDVGREITKIVEW